MNALFELLGETISRDNYDQLIAHGTTFEDYEIEFSLKVGRAYVKLTPKWGSTVVREWFNRVKFATIDCKGTSLSLPSKRTEEDEQEFFAGLASIDYDDGYGMQELYGVIVFNDHSWLTRGEYDGSEWWQKHVEPQEENYIK
jgi:hypothetical protein